MALRTFTLNQLFVTYAGKNSRNHLIPLSKIKFLNQILTPYLPRDCKFPPLRNPLRGPPNPARAPPNPARAPPNVLVFPNVATLSSSEPSDDSESDEFSTVDTVDFFVSNKPVWVRDKTENERKYGRQCGLWQGGKWRFANAKI